MSILQCTDQCIQLLEAQSFQKTKTDAQLQERVVNICVRLKIWAGGMGVFSLEENAIDHCFQNKEVMDLVLVLLSRLLEILEQAFSIPAVETNDPETLYEEEPLYESDTSESSSNLSSVDDDFESLPKDSLSRADAVVSDLYQISRTIRRTHPSKSKDSSSEKSFMSIATLPLIPETEASGVNKSRSDEHERFTSGDGSCAQEESKGRVQRVPLLKDAVDGAVANTMAAEARTATSSEHTPFERTLSANSSRPSKRLVVFCNGSWIGHELHVAGAPTSNIRQLANMVGEIQYKDSLTQETAIHPIRIHPRILSRQEPTVRSGETRSSFPHKDITSHAENTPSIIAGYQEGVGLNRNFLDYIWDSSTASSIEAECISVYRFIVEYYTADHEIWLFGFSRGSFTVRCLAGMINNCGIIKRSLEYTEDEIQALCVEVFRTYKSHLPGDKPHSDKCEHFKSNLDRVWQAKRPIRFMGIIDTVGALGIPCLNQSVGFHRAPHEFFDQQMSSTVQHVYHAVALHDRLCIFQPCLVFSSKGDKQVEVNQRWFPGTHYDVGRVTFRFLPQSLTNWIENLFGQLPSLLFRTIRPNEVLSDCVLRWLLEGVREVDARSTAPIISDVEARIQHLNETLANGKSMNKGSGDIYGDVLDHVPGSVILKLIQRVSQALIPLLSSALPLLGSNIQDRSDLKTIIGILTATTDRRVPGDAEDVYPYSKEENVQVVGTTKTLTLAQQADLGGLNELGKPRYQSKTYESFLLWKKFFTTRNTEHSYKH